MTCYRSKKQRDGTYRIEESNFGLNWSILLTGVRGCNVSRTINRLYLEDYEYDLLLQTSKLPSQNFPLPTSR